MVWKKPGSLAHYVMLGLVEGARGRGTNSEEGQEEHGSQAL